MTVRVPGKVNLHLGIGPRRRDGYHDVASVYQAVSIQDEVAAAAGPGLSVTTSGPEAAAVPAGAANLAARAAVALARHTGVAPDAHLSISKRIPVAGGMAGGSADAAAALVACDALWGTHLDRPQLHALAAGLGSDVPFALHGGTALGVGRGELLSPVLARGTCHWVLAFAAQGMSTPAVYAELDRQRTGTGAGMSDPAPVLAALRAGDPAALGRALTNDLQRAALRLRPGLRRVLDAGLDLGALGAVVSGSGPTCALLVRSEPEAVRVAAALAGLDVCSRVRRATGPVPGARVVPGGEG